MKNLENGQVTISVEDFERLRAIEHAYQDGKTVVTTWTIYGNSDKTYTIPKTDVVAAELGAEINRLHSEISNLHKEINSLNEVIKIKSEKRWSIFGKQ